VRVGGAAVDIVQGDITEQETEAIVNAANPSLMGGGGVDGAIHRKGGPAILEECRIIRETQWRNGLPVGKAVLTTGGHLKARFVIHTVGPVWRGGHSGEAEMLADCYRSSLSLAVSKGISTISFPSISTGAFGYPIPFASKVALGAVKEFLEIRDGLNLVTFVLFSLGDLGIYEKTAAQIFSK
jgi:O-acetyl-ADP-ribose deacetylase